MVTTKLTAYRLRLILVVVVLASCGSTGDPIFTTELDAKGNPIWVTRGTNTIKTHDHRLFHGVGYADVTTDFSTGAFYADKIAKDALANLLDEYFETVSRHYLASASARSAGFTHRIASGYLAQFSKLELSRATVVDHWKDSKKNTIYSVAQFELKKLAPAMEQIDNMKADFRGYFKREGARIFDHMASREDL